MEQTAVAWAMTLLFVNKRLNLATELADAMIFEMQFYGALDDAANNIKVNFLYPLIDFSQQPSWSQGVNIYISQVPITQAKWF